MKDDKHSKGKITFNHLIPTFFRYLTQRIEFPIDIIITESNTKTIRICV